MGEKWTPALQAAPTPRSFLAGAVPVDRTRGGPCGRRRAVFGLRHQLLRRSGNRRQRSSSPLHIRQHHHTRRPCQHCWRQHCWSCSLTGRRTPARAGPACPGAALRPEQARRSSVKGPQQHCRPCVLCCAGSHRLSERGSHSRQPCACAPPAEGSWSDQLWADAGRQAEITKLSHPSAHHKFVGFSPERAGPHHIGDRAVRAAGISWDVRDKAGQLTICWPEQSASSLEMGIVHSAS